MNTWVFGTNYPSKASNCKVDAVKRQQFEEAALLRDAENVLVEKMNEAGEKILALLNIDQEDKTSVATGGDSSTGDDPIK